MFRVDPDDCLKILGASASWSPRGVSRLLQGQPCLSEGYAYVLILYKGTGILSYLFAISAVTSLPTIWRILSTLKTFNYT